MGWGSEFTGEILIGPHRLNLEMSTGPIKSFQRVLKKQLVRYQ